MKLEDVQQERAHSIKPYQMFDNLLEKSRNNCESNRLVDRWLIYTWPWWNRAASPWTCVDPSPSVQQVWSGKSLAFYYAHECRGSQDGRSACLFGLRFPNY